MNKKIAAVVATGLTIAVSAFTFNAVADGDRGYQCDDDYTEYSQGDNMHKRYGKRGKRDGHRMDKLFAKLDVTDEQKAQIEAIRANYKPQMETLRENSGDLRAQKKNLDPTSPSYVAEVQNLFDQGTAKKRQAVTLRAQMKSEIAQVLTPEQRAEMKELKERFKEKRGKRGRRGHH